MRLLAAAIVSAATLVPLCASAETIQRYKVANWELSAHTNDNTGRFTHCAAAGRYRNGSTLFFSLSESLEWGISFSNPEWGFEQGRNVNINFRIDNGRDNTLTGRAVNKSQVVARLTNTAELLDQFRAGSRLSVNLNNALSVTFNLTDTTAVLAEVLQCANKYKGHVGPSRDAGLRESRVETPPARELEQPRLDRIPAEPPIAPASLPTAESRAEATAMATDILRRANFDFEIQKPESLSAEMRDRYDVVWRADGALGTLRVLSGPRAIAIERLRGHLIALGADTCKGRFASGAFPVTSNSPSQMIFTSCESEGHQAVYYIAVPRRKGGVYLLGISGSGEVAARLQNVANAYRTVALEVLER